MNLTAEAFERLTAEIPLARRRLLRHDIELLQKVLDVPGDYVGDRRGIAGTSKIVGTWARKRDRDRSWELVGTQSGHFADVNVAEAVAIMGVTENSLKVRTSGAGTFTRTRVLIPKGDAELVTCRRLPPDERVATDVQPEQVTRLLRYLESNGGYQGRRF